MGQYSGQAMHRYEKQLMEARKEDAVGIHKHMHRPTEPTSRLGFRGKKVSKKGLIELAEKLTEAAKRHPHLLPAALNAVQRANGIKAQNKAKQQAKPKQEHTISVEEAKAILKQIEAQQPKIETPKSMQPEEMQGPKKPQPPPLTEYELRQKLLAEQKAKLVAAMSVNQFGRNVRLNCRNNPG